jgi:hypothetical protein
MLIVLAAHHVDGRTIIELPAGAHERNQHLLLLLHGARD